MLLDSSASRRLRARFLYWPTVEAVFKGVVAIFYRETGQSCLPLQMYEVA